MDIRIEYAGIRKFTVKRNADEIRKLRRFQIPLRNTSPFVTLGFQNTIFGFTTVVWQSDTPFPLSTPDICNAELGLAREKSTSDAESFQVMILHDDFAQTSGQWTA